MSSIPSALHPYNKRKKKKSYGIKVCLDLLRLVSLLSLNKSKVGGRGQFDRLFLKTNQVNTKVFMEGVRLVL